MTALLATLAAALPVHHTDCETVACVERVAAKRCDQHHVTSCIHRAALRWRVSYRMLRRKAWCESRFDPYARNGQYRGLYQFGDIAWNASPYSSHSVWSAKWSSLAAAWAHSEGHASWWECR